MSGAMAIGVTGLIVLAALYLTRSARGRRRFLIGLLVYSLVGVGVSLALLFNPDGITRTLGLFGIIALSLMARTFWQELNAQPLSSPEGTPTSDGETSSEESKQ